MLTIRLLTFLITIIAFQILFHLINTRDGNLRKILIAYFAVECFIYSACLYYEIKMTFPDFYQSVAIMFLIPKSVIKLIFYSYISKRGKGEHLIK